MPLSLIICCVVIHFQLQRTKLATVSRNYIYINENKLWNIMTSTYRMLIACYLLYDGSFLIATNKVGQCPIQHNFSF